MCKECESLKVIIVTLKDTIRRQNQTIQDLGGKMVEWEDDPYEDEQPLIPWEPKE